MASERAQAWADVERNDEQTEAFAVALCRLRESFSDDNEALLLRAANELRKQAFDAGFAACAAELRELYDPNRSNAAIAAELAEARRAIVTLANGGDEWTLTGASEFAFVSNQIAKARAATEGK
jgi:hypothetical protein